MFPDNSTPSLKGLLRGIKPANYCNYDGHSGQHISCHYSNQKKQPTSQPRSEKSEEKFFFSKPNPIVSFCEFEEVQQVLDYRDDKVEKKFPVIKKIPSP